MDQVGSMSIVGDKKVNSDVRSASCGADGPTPMDRVWFYSLQIP